MIFVCNIDFVNDLDPAKRTSANFLMRARSFNEIERKLNLVSNSGVFYGWRATGTRARKNVEHNLSHCLCTYGNVHGFQGTFKMSPVLSTQK